MSQTREHDHPTADRETQKRRRIDSNLPTEVIDLVSSSDEDDLPNDAQVEESASISANSGGIHASSATLEEDESDDDIIDVYCSGKLITFPSIDDPGNNHDDEYVDDTAHDHVDNGPPLCPEQEELVEIIMRGCNVFYTGSAGSGKSRVLKAFTAKLRAENKKVYIVAPTGRAALEVGGSTTWTYAGWDWQSFKLPLEKLRAAAYTDHVKKRLRETDVLVIDEISMVENHHFERLSEIMKEVRQSEEAFGGVQIVVTGDFHQLPPVKPFRRCIECGKDMTKDGETYTCQVHGDFYDKNKWAFRSNAWKECEFITFFLKTVHRQSDKEFIRILNKVGIGDDLDEKEIDLLMNHQSFTGNATRLHATKGEVRKVNQKAFERLKTESYTYKCRDYFNWNEKHTGLDKQGERLYNGTLKALYDHSFEVQVELKVGALVVLLINLDLDRKLCNGSQGIICGFEEYDPEKRPRAIRGKKDDNPNVIRGEHARLKERQIEMFIEKAEKKVWPRVRFHNGEVRTIYANCAIDCLGDEEPYTILCRTQIPLATAWAMSIHKSQSLTMDRVIVDLSRAWENGQVYVALSRATSLEGLKIEGSWRGSTVGDGGDPTVREFYAKELGM